MSQRDTTDRMSVAHRARPVVRWASTVLLGACAAFWSWFALSVGFSEGTPAAAPVAGLVGSMAVLVITGVLVPRIGGMIALAAAAIAAWLFHSADARLLLALPVAVAGLGLATTGPWIFHPSQSTR